MWLVIVSLFVVYPEDEAQFWFEGRSEEAGLGCSQGDDKLVGKVGQADK